MPQERLKILIDGTTLTMPPVPELHDAFPPATNQHGESVWPLMMMFVGHDLKTGCALSPEIGPMYGNKADSELKMARRMFTRLPTNSIVVGDAGLGIFSVFQGAVEQGHDAVMRLSNTRFKSLTKKATAISDDTWSLVWTPTAKERKTTPELPEDAQVAVRIHREIIDGKGMYLATTLLRHSGAQVFDIYKCRQDVETDIGDIKVTMNTENIRAKTKDSFLKELYTSLIAYNSIVQFRRDAARVANKPPRRISFKGVLDTFNIFLSSKLMALPVQDCLIAYQRALAVASKDVIRHRPGRTFRRAAHPRRPKTTKWQKQQRKASKTEDEQKQDASQNKESQENSS